jgi:osmotically-inducible protein OsmY
MNAESIADAVTEELLFDPAVSHNYLDIEVVDGIVELKGHVENLLSKRRARRLAETVKGVRAVINRIQVQPAEPRSDSVLRSDIEIELLADPATEAFEVDVEVEDGTAVLTGEVQSWPEKHLVERVAMRVRGLEDVKNKLKVNPPASRPDSEMAEDIRASLRWSTLVDHGLIDVKVEGGEAELSGIVGSAAEKREARRLAWRSGIIQIDDSELKVKKWNRDSDLRHDKYTGKTDKEVAAALRDALLYDPRVAGFKIDADVKTGKAILRGIVDNLKAKRAAEQDARNTIGVYDVANHIRVRASKEITDLEMEESITDALKRSPFLEEYDVSVDVRNSVANLYGTVDTYFEKSQADDIASRTKGVVGVDNNLDVRNTELLVYEPFVDEFPYYLYAWYEYNAPQTWMTDAEIDGRIQAQIWWSPYVDSEDVEVEVDDGVATLTGEVDSWMELWAATTNAYEGGAVMVDNDLQVAN